MLEANKDSLLAHTPSRRSCESHIKLVGKNSFERFIIPSKKGKKSSIKIKFKSFEQDIHPLLTAELRSSLLATRQDLDPTCSKQTVKSAKSNNKVTRYLGLRPKRYKRPECGGKLKFGHDHHEMTTQSKDPQLASPEKDVRTKGYEVSLVVIFNLVAPSF